MIMDEMRFFAWLDGELPADEAAEVAALVAADLELQRKADAHRAMQAKLANAFAPIARAPVALPEAEVVDLAAARERRRAIPSVMQWGAIAATLMVGIVTGTMIARPTPSPIAEQQGALVASASLGDALNKRLASTQDDDGPRIGLTFRDKEGSICRSFHDGAAQGLACRDGDEWRLRGLVQGLTEPTGDYRMATGDDPAIAALISDAMAGDPFDAVQEKAAKDAGWR